MNRDLPCESTSPASPNSTVASAYFICQFLIKFSQYVYYLMAELYTGTTNKIIDLVTETKSFLFGEMGLFRLNYHLLNMFPEGKALIKKHTDIFNNKSCLSI